MADETKSEIGTSGMDWAGGIGSAAAKNMQVFASEIANMSKQSYEHATQTLEKLREAKSVEDLVSIQSTFVRESLDSFTQRSRKLAEVMSTFPHEMTKAYQDAMMKAADAAMQTTKAAGKAMTDVVSKARDSMPKP